MTAHRLLGQSSGLRDLPPTVFSSDDAGLKENIPAWSADVFFDAPNRIYMKQAATVTAAFVY